jgi:tRNA 2-selenouridine synthase
VERWQALARAGDWPAVFEQMMTQHYDPLYERSMQRSYADLGSAEVVELADEGEAALVDAARRLTA